MLVCFVDTLGTRAVAIQQLDAQNIDLVFRSVLGIMAKFIEGHPLLGMAKTKKEKERRTLVQAATWVGGRRLRRRQASKQVRERERDR